MTPTSLNLHYPRPLIRITIKILTHKKKNPSDKCQAFVPKVLLSVPKYWVSSEPYQEIDKTTANTSWIVVNG